MSIIAIDPGTTNTGLVYMDERRVICSHYIHYPQAVKDNQEELRNRILRICRQCENWAADKPHDAIVLEGYINFPGKQSQYTFQTPQLVGALQLTFANENLIMQTSRQVLNPHTHGNCAYVKTNGLNGVRVWPGCEHFGKNDHLFSALAHGVYYYQQRGKHGTN